MSRHCRDACDEKPASVMSPPSVPKLRWGVVTAT
jgi:hypothetical protein